MAPDDEVNKETGLTAYDLTPEGRENLVIKYKPLVYKCARKFARYFNGLAYDDVFADCWYAIFKAARTYEPGHGAKFTTWAMRIAYHVVKRRVVQTRNRGFTGVGRNATKARCPCFVDTTRDGELAKVETVAAPVDEVGTRWDRATWERVLSCIPCPRKRTALVKYLAGGVTYEQIGAEMNVCRERVRQYISYAVNMIRVHHPWLEGELETDRCR